MVRKFNHTNNISKSIGGFRMKCKKCNTKVEKCNDCNNDFQSIKDICCCKTDFAKEILKS
jgi:hypothetical protein